MSICIFVVFRLGFGCETVVLIVPGPGHCLHFAFVGNDADFLYFYEPIVYIFL